MSILKKIFGEKRPIQDLFNLQKKLEQYGMIFMFRDLVQKNNEENEAKLRKTVVEDILVKSENAIKVNQRNLWVALNSNAQIKNYQPKGSGYFISEGDQVVIEVGYEVSRSTPSPIEHYTNSLKNDIKSIFDNASVIEDIIRFEYNIKSKDDYSKSISLVNLYVSDNPEITKTISIDSLIEACSKQLELNQIKFFNYNTFYQSETHIYGETINSKSLKNHEVVIDALCAALEGLKDRKNFTTYEHLSEYIEHFISSRKTTGSAYFEEVHIQFKEEYLMKYPLGYFITSSASKGNELRGPIRTHQSIYLCPFVGRVHYGMTVTITDNGFKAGKEPAIT
ncbi:hypothetical protein MNBD_GAMMA09-3314 [hydrothermal vent metagenome]|uniref:Uncharacterized protein n=1 Tax=hydrothermal vent metagenome TaxID=652676 RepID=A0A3B0XM84_9ZZZZ